MKSTTTTFLFVSVISLISRASACTSYKVQSGDYCGLIASKFSISPWTLLRNWNPSINADCTNLQVGQSICVSGGGSSTTPPPTSGGATHYGDNAKYHIYGSGSLGACGFSVDDTSYMAVAVSQKYFTSSNPNLDPICNTLLTIVATNGKSIQAKIVDKKAIAPPDWSVDLNAVAYDALGGNHNSPGNIAMDHYTFNAFSTLPGAGVARLRVAANANITITKPEKKKNGGKPKPKTHRKNGNQ
ncbi:hypothetical protein BC938DRAFT_474772 [Jimgerdemannia flammicorona]|uniref:LysM domain-containing protein n=1 Tax=Jimgerdemannia flammicorona TaxID=994334 RepID=A0A433Q1X5_9FUNG|nr:hypothetical protein BC938DRAFT_474772 [Jimgerdemannia flammicorona]